MSTDAIRSGTIFFVIQVILLWLWIDDPGEQDGTFMGIVLAVLWVIDCMMFYKKPPAKGQ